MNARGKLAVDIVSYFFSVVSPHTKDRGAFQVYNELNGTRTVILTIRPLHTNSAIGTPYHNVESNARDEVGMVAGRADYSRACCTETAELQSCWCCHVGPDNTVFLLDLCSCCITKVADEKNPRTCIFSCKHFQAQLAASC